MKCFPAWCVVIAGLWVCACQNIPTTPTTETIVPVLEISPVIKVLYIGGTQTYVALNATAGAVLTWASSDARVLTIDSAGIVTAIAAGLAVITVSTSDGYSASLDIQVVPHYAGTWTGQTVTVACYAIGGFADRHYCSQSATVEPFTLTLTQDDLSVGGTLTKSEGGDQLVGAVSGGVGVTGEITLGGSLSGVSNGVNLTLTLISWNSLATGTSMTGIWSANLTSSQVLGIATVQWSITGATLATASGSPVAGLMRSP
jgi:hypothetical protein